MAYSLSISYTHVLTHERKVSAMLFIIAVFTFLCNFKSTSTITLAACGAYQTVARKK